MGADAQAPDRRDLPGLASKLRDYAAQTRDPRYVAMFLAAAKTLEARARTEETDDPRHHAVQHPGR